MEQESREASSLLVPCSCLEAVREPLGIVETHSFAWSALLAAEH